MFDNLNWWEIAALALLALFIFGPDRLPRVIGDAGKMLRRVRQMARNATADLREEIGTDIDLDDLNPRSFVRKHLLSEEDEEELIRRPMREAYSDVKQYGAAVSAEDEPSRPSMSKNANGAAARPAGGAPRYDADAT